MPLGADYPFLDLFWTMLIVFVWITWFWLLITVFGDVFRRRDIGGGKKTLWLIFVILVPFLGVFIYLMVNNQGMTERKIGEVQAQQQQFDEYVPDGGHPRWCGRGDREGEAVARQRRDHAGRVRRPQAEGARLGAGREELTSAWRTLPTDILGLRFPADAGR